jgi:thioredoxin-related protein
MRLCAHRRGVCRPDCYASRPVKLLLALALTLAALPARANEIPDWFAETFLDVREDAAEAATQGKRLLLYFWLEGCPYCERMEKVTFRDPQIVARMRREFVAVAINVRGDRAVTWSDGATLTEKTLTSQLKIRGTPTLVFFDEQGGVAWRATGYLDPAQLDTTLDRARAPRSASP